jgi:hypothetical protein
VKDLEAKLNYITEAVPINPQNIQGSTAGAGSGEFHLYRAGRRREQMRIAAMEREDNANVAKAEFEARQEARTREAEEKTAKNRNKRKAKKVRCPERGPGRTTTRRRTISSRSWTENPSWPR